MVHGELDGGEWIDQQTTGTRSSPWGSPGAVRRTARIVMLEGSTIAIDRAPTSSCHPDPGLGYRVVPTDCKIVGRNRE
jgi:hypothetical protein